MVSAVVLATYLPSRRSLAILIETLDYLEQHFGDCDIYVGINPSPYVTLGIELLRKSSLNFRYIEASAHLDTRSDASAFQAAMLIMKQSQAIYDLVYFMHLKGASLSAEYQVTTANGEEIEFNIRHWMFNLFRERSRIEKMFAENERVGTFGHSLGKSKHRLDMELGDLISLPLPPFETYQYFYTFYAIRGGPLHYLINSFSERFWSTNLLKLSDKYFFERDFTQLIWRQGYIPTYECLTTINDCLEIDDASFRQDAISYLRTYNTNQS